MTSLPRSTGEDLPSRERQMSKEMPGRHEMSSPVSYSRGFSVQQRK